MCLAVPMMIKEVLGDGSGKADIDGSVYHVDLSLLEDVGIGDYVIVHAGFAIEKLDPDEADIRLKLFEELAQANVQSE